MRVELLGPASVGKSVIVKNIQHLWEDRIAFHDKIKEFIKKAPAGEVVQFVNIFLKNAVFDEYLAHTLSSVAKAEMSFGRKFNVIGYVHDSIIQYAVSERFSSEGNFLLHDDLLLQRCFSFLHVCDDFEEMARQYYEKVPVPEAAIIFRAPVATIMERIGQSGVTKNCHIGLSGEGLRVAVLKSLAICSIAAETLGSRGVDVHFVDASRAVEETSTELNDILSELFLSRAKRPDAPGADSDSDLKARTIETSRSFRRRAGRHYPRTPDVAYCAFTTPNFTVHRSESQRDASVRFRNFGLDEGVLRGKRVLDLGSHIGAMLFQATNYSIAEGLGIEFDYDKVKIAREIAELSQLNNLSFRQGDLDALVAEELGTFDITFALAVEGHLQKPERLYALLGEVTKERLYFEGNMACDVKAVMEILRNVGFSQVEFLGLCSDDIVPGNNRRPMLRAVK